MATRILVAYATRYGSTKEVAEKVAATLRQAGLEVDLQPARDVRDLTPYEGVVVGAPLIIGRWHKDARQFVSRQRRALETLRVAVFALGPTHDPRDEEEWANAQKQVDKTLAAYPWLKLTSIALFGGKYDMTLLRWPLNKLAGSVPSSDIRDWAEIGAWAGALVERLTG